MSDMICSEASTICIARGFILKANMAATAEMKPSMITGSRYIAAPMKMPVSPAISRPPTFAIISISSANGA